MPDKNKLKALGAASYSIQDTCGNCQFSDLRGDWGTCSAISYQHQKHTGQQRQVSIHRYGYCREYKRLQMFEGTLQASGFDVFMRPSEDSNGPTG